MGSKEEEMISKREPLSGWRQSLPTGFVAMYPEPPERCVKPPAKRKPIANRSAKRIVEDRERAKCMKIVKERSEGRCEFREHSYRCPLGAVDGHEVISRAAGGSIVDPSNVLHLCRLHHDWIHQNPEAAKRMGLLASRYEGRRP